jgi:hypothetical protein
VAICTNQGEEVQVVAYLGKHPLPGRPETAFVLLHVRTVAEPRETFGYFARYLRATGGPSEIDAAVDGAPEVKLGSEALRKAIHEAE